MCAFVAGSADTDLRGAGEALDLPDLGEAGARVAVVPADGSFPGGVCLRGKCSASHWRSECRSAGWFGLGEVSELRVQRT